MFYARISKKYRTFAAAKRTTALNHSQNRDVAQLVAHYVRDVGVGRSSRLIPTKTEVRKQKGADYSAPYFYVNLAQPHWCQRCPLLRLRFVRQAKDIGNSLIGNLALYYIQALGQSRVILASLLPALIGQSHSVAQGGISQGKS